VPADSCRLHETTLALLPRGQVTLLYVYASSIERVGFNWLEKHVLVLRLY